MSQSREQIIERLYFIERIDTAQIARWYKLREDEVWNILAHGDPARKWPNLWRAVKKRTRALFWQGR
jgi:hypothetical protein